MWKLRASEKDNHQLDVSIYCRALAEHLGLSSLTADEWAALAKERGGVAMDDTPLFSAAARPAPAPAEAAVARHAPSAAAVVRPESDLERLERENAGLSFGW